jgi:hypothetical protein
MSAYLLVFVINFFFNINSGLWNMCFFILAMLV